MTPVQQAANEYLELGLDAIPLNPGSKFPLLAGWQNSDPFKQWRDAPENSNIGLRCGGERRLAVFDTDDDKRPTWPTVYGFLCSLGLEPGSYPVIQTPSGGRHAYLALAGTLEGSYRLYKSDFGAGEFRYGSGAYVAAPPSSTTTGGYKLLSGDLRELPRIYIQDILHILSEANQITGPQAALTRRKPSRKALALLAGIGLDRYQSRSEAEQAILSSLAQCNLEFSEVLTLFTNHEAAGRFKEMFEKSPRNAVKWLESSYRQAQEWIATHESRERIAAQEALEWAKNTPWPGKTGSIDRAVFIAHASIAHKAATLTYAASSRTLAELSGVERRTATRATHRLCDANLLEVQRQAVGECSNTYRLMLHPGTTSQVLCDEVGIPCNIAAHDLFRAKGLGKAAAEVYRELLAEPLTVTKLVERTGRNRVTVWRVLRNMAKIADPLTGELLPMVEQEGDNWRALHVDFDQLARIYGTFGKLEKQKAAHRRERELHKWSFTNGNS